VPHTHARTQNPPLEAVSRQPRLRLSFHILPSSLCPFFIISWTVIPFFFFFKLQYHRQLFILSFYSTTTTQHSLDGSLYSVDAVPPSWRDKYIPLQRRRAFANLGLRERSTTNTPLCNGDAGRLTRYPRIHSITTLYTPFTRHLLSRWITQSSRLPFERLNNRYRASHKNRSTTNNTLINPQTHHFRHKHNRLGRSNQHVMYELDEHDVHHESRGRRSLL